VSDDVLTIEQLDDEIVVLTLNRPERRNALSIGLMDALCQTLEAFAAQEQFRVVILCGAGAAFCAGLDLNEAAEAELAERSAMCVARTFQTLSDYPQLTIAAVHGAAYAGGAGLMACCDFIIAADDLKVCFPEVRRGLVPALATVALGSRMRDGDRRELLLLAEPIDARRALDMGLVDRVVPADRLMTAVKETATTVLKGAPHAVQLTKRLLKELAPVDRHHQFARALEIHSRARHGDEAREGLAAFHERRDPNWTLGTE
jgi:methylglutaconyl-CoA hydratase